MFLCDVAAGSGSGSGAGSGSGLASVAQQQPRRPRTRASAAAASLAAEPDDEDGEGKDGGTEVPQAVQSALRTLTNTVRALFFWPALAMLHSLIWLLLRFLLVDRCSTWRRTCSQPPEVRAVSHSRSAMLRPLLFG